MLKLERMHRQTGETFMDPTAIAVLGQMIELLKF